MSHLKDETFVKTSLERIIRLSPCAVYHMGWEHEFDKIPNCVQIANHAKRHTEKYGAKFRVELMRGKHFCRNCNVRTTAQRALRNL